MVFNLDTGAETKCMVMEPMCKIMFYNQLPTSDTIHKWTVAPEVEPGHWGGHQVFGHGTDVSNHVL